MLLRLTEVTIKHSPRNTTRLENNLVCKIHSVHLLRSCILQSLLRSIDRLDLEFSLEIMLQMKVYICCKTLSNCIQIHKSKVTNQRSRAIRSLRVKCAPVTGITKGIVMAQYNRSLLVRH